MSVPAVSIIIPVYNASKYIVRALNSIRSQTFSDYEVIVVDDGSIDSSVLIIQAHALDINLIKKVNGGVSSARNVGIKAAKGKYIAFLDADDEWLPSKLSVQIMYIEKNTALIAVYCKDYDLRGQLNIINHSSPALIEKNCEEIFMHPYNLTTSSFVIKSSVIRKVGGFDENLNTAEDIDLYLKASLLGSIGELSESLCIKHDVEDSLGSISSSYEDNLQVISSFFKRNVNDLPESFEKKFLAMKIYILNSWCEELLWQNHFMRAFKVGCLSLKVQITRRAVYLLLKVGIKLLFNFKKQQ